MAADLLQLYPPPGARRSLRGLYLQHELHTRGRAGKPFIYANFVASLDGRIALKGDKEEDSRVPEILTTQADWCLFQELQAQADCFVTHGGYLRALAAGRLDDILHFAANEDNQYLLDWRANNGLQAQPGVAVLSASLNFPPPPGIKQRGQRFHIITTERAERIKIRAWQSKGYDVRMIGSDALVQARPLQRLLGELGYTSVYLEAGPTLLESMLRDSVLDRLYLTQSHALLGANGMHSLIAADLGRNASSLQLSSLCLEPRSEHGCGQVFACFDCVFK